MADLASTISSGLRKIAADTVALADEIDALTPAPPVPPSPVPPPPSIAGLNILASAVASAKAKATANTAQWQAFKARLDSRLSTIFTGGYEGSDLQWIANYALGYQSLKDSDPATAQNYADKAIGLLKSALRDYQVGGWCASRFLTRGDGATTTFTLPDADVVSSSVMVWLSPISTIQVSRSSTGKSDEIGYYYYPLKISNTSDGAVDYVEGTDWRHNGDLRYDMIDWLGKEPAVGATYYVTAFLPLVMAPQVGAVVKGNQVTLPTAPDANHAVLVGYVYGTHAADGSTLAYQQTSAGDGGFNSIFIDTTYTSRYLGAYVSIGLDWLDGYVGLSDALKAEAIDLLKRWSDWLPANGYYYDSPVSNYGAGSYFSDALTALALQGRDSTAASYLTKLLAYRTANLLPAIQNDTTSLKGGFWAEGWNYGAMASRNLLIAAMALEGANAVTVDAEHAWASDVVRQLLSESASTGTIYDGGDGYAYPAPMPNEALISVLSAAASDANAKAYANQLLPSSPAEQDAIWIKLLFYDPSAPVSPWSAEPLANFASGTGLLTARSDWGATPVWASCQIGNLLQADHQSVAPGQVQIQRGADDLLVNAAHVGGYQDSHTETRYGNTVVIDDNVAGSQNYRFNIGFWYGSPGVVTKASELTADYAYLYGDYHAAYSLNTAPGAGGPAKELARQFVYLRPDIVVVYDRVTTLRDTDQKQLRWHFLNVPAVNGDSFIASAGQSKLFGEIYSAVPLVTTAAQVAVNSAMAGQLISSNAAPTVSVRYVTALQVADASVQTAYPTAHIVSIDQQLEGVQIGQNVVLFGRNGDASLASPISYSINTAGSVSHWIANLPAGTQCKVSVDGAAIGEFAMSSAGVLEFKTTANETQSITIEAAA